MAAAKVVDVPISSALEPSEGPLPLRVDDVNARVVHCRAPKRQVAARFFGGRFR